MFRALLLALAIYSPVVSEKSQESRTEASQQEEAMRQYGEGNFLEATRLLEAVVKTHPDRGPAYFYLGLSYYKAGRYREAISPLQRALSLQADERDTLLYLSRALYLSNRDEEAVYYGSRLIELLPEDPAALLTLTQAAWRLSKKAFARLYEVAPDSPQYHQLLAEELEANRKFSEALNAYQNAIDRAPKETGLHFSKARVFLKMVDTAKAVEELKKELAISPFHSLTQLMIGSIYLEQQRLQDAVHHLTAAIEIDPQLAPAYIGLAQAHIIQEEPEKAVGRLKEAIQLDPESKEARYVLARAYTLLGKTEDARKELEIFRELNAKNQQK